MKYKISVEYQTGDSNNSYRTSDDIAIEFTDLQCAKNALKRIEEHYKWTEYLEYPAYREKVEMPKWLENEKIPKGMEAYRMIFELENGSKYVFMPMWVGYFESLHKASIVEIDDNRVFEPKK